MRIDCKTAWAALFLAGSLLADTEYLPLQEGNTWIYRQVATSQTLTISVGTPTVLAGNTYYRLTGYATEPLWVRYGDYGALYYRDETRNLDILLTSFERFTGGWFAAPFRFCADEGQGQDTYPAYKGPAGQFPSTLVIRYRAFQCADAGVIQEQFAANIGMVQRTEQSFIGPRSYDLVSARVGNLVIQADPRASLTLSTLKDPAATTLTATLDLAAFAPVTLRYLSAQEFDMLLRSADGTVLWKWSDGRVFAQFVRDVTTMSQTWTAEVPLQAPGNYQLEAWITSGIDRPQFAAAVPVVIPQ